MTRAQKDCSVCGQEFLVKNPDQMRRTSEEIEYFCSDECRQRDRSESGDRKSVV